jgi:hypothetical protein
MSRDWLRCLSNIWEQLPADDLETAIRESTTLFVCVSTPQRGNGETDLLQGRKSRLCRITKRFSSVAKGSEFTDHRPKVDSPRPFRPFLHRTTVHDVLKMSPIGSSVTYWS